MKRTIPYVIALCFLWASCSTQDDCDSYLKFSPATYYIYFELKNGEDFFEDEEVFISNKHEMQNGEIVPIPFYNGMVEWHPLYQVVIDYQPFETTVFGYKGMDGLGNPFYSGVFVGSGPTTECGYNNWSRWDKNNYYLLKFPNGDVDTLHIRDQKKAFGYPEYSIFLNGISIDYEVQYQDYITIQK